MKHYKRGIASILSIFSAYAAADINIYAAASLQPALQQIQQQYQNVYPKQKVTLVLASSSHLARQIQYGAPADIFFSADQAWMQYLQQKHHIASASINRMLTNQLVVVSLNKNIQFQANRQFNFPQAFQGRICTGQTETVPLGKYTKQALHYFNWYPALKQRLIAADDARMAVKFVENGACEVGVVYKTDALLSQKLHIIGVLPQRSYVPIIYPVALTRQGQKNPQAQQFLKFLQQPYSQGIFRQYGFGTL